VLEGWPQPESCTSVQRPCLVSKPGVIAAAPKLIFRRSVRSCSLAARGSWIVAAPGLWPAGQQYLVPLGFLACDRRGGGQRAAGSRVTRAPVACDRRGGATMDMASTTPASRPLKSRRRRLQAAARRPSLSAPRSCSVGCPAPRATGTTARVRARASGGDRRAMGCRRGGERIGAEIFLSYNG
jgi:hypothetical protein